MSFFNLLANFIVTSPNEHCLRTSEIVSSGYHYFLSFKLHFTMSSSWNVNLSSLMLRLSRIVKVLKSFSLFICSFSPSKLSWSYYLYSLLFTTSFVTAQIFKFQISLNLFNNIAIYSRFPWDCVTKFRENRIFKVSLRFKKSQI